MPYTCPEDGALLASRGQLLHCPDCGASYRLAGRCADCGAPLERLVACGSASWFCPRCNALQSKTRAQVRLERER